MLFAIRNKSEEILHTFLMKKGKLLEMIMQRKVKLWRTKPNFLKKKFLKKKCD